MMTRNVKTALLAAIDNFTAMPIHGFDTALAWLILVALINVHTKIPVERITLENLRAIRAEIAARPIVEDN